LLKFYPCCLPPPSDVKEVDAVVCTPVHRVEVVVGPVFGVVLTDVFVVVEVFGVDEVSFVEVLKNLKLLNAF
jgi:hypothetical protein